MVFFVILAVIAFVVIRSFIKKRERNRQIEELKQLILESDMGKCSYDRVETFCRENDVSDEEYHEIRKNLYYELAEGDDIHAIKMAAAYAYDEDPSAHLQYLTRAAELGDVESMYSLGVTYDVDDAFPGCPDKEEAFYWYERAAEHGHEKALCSVAQAYETGEGVGKNVEKAFSILKDASERGYSHCGLRLAEFYYESCASGHYDLKLAKQIYEQIMQRGDRETFAKAAHQMGMLYGGSYVFDAPVNEFSDRRKAAYCFALAHFLDSDLYDADLIRKTGYRWTEFEMKKWQQDAVRLRYDPM